ncbi:MAG: 1-acyl-sn-glycerol-3-phosphate acyltransferase [Chitinophagaceae bacterium]
MTTGLRFFYRRIHVTGFENIPEKGPVIIIANHNSSLMDAALLGILLKRKAWFFARGDVFIKKFVSKILWQFHMMPVHSYSGGRHTLSANSDSFADGKKILSKGGIIVFFPESTSHTQHQLYNFRKGVFRLAFETASEADFSYDIPIVPIGITYDHPINCRAAVQVHAGKPLLLSTYIHSYKLNPAAALLQISKDAYQSVLQLTLHIPDTDRLQTVNHFLTLNRSSQTQQYSSWKIASMQKLIQEKTVCNYINNAGNDELETWQLKTTTYFKLLAENDVTDKAVHKEPSFSFLKKMGLWLGFPFYIIGLLLNGLPIGFARLIANKKVYRQDFYSWIFVAVYSMMYLCWMLLLISITFFVWGWQYAFMLLAIMISTGLFAYLYKDWMKENSIYNKWKMLSSKNREALISMRKNLTQVLTEKEAV